MTQEEVDSFLEENGIDVSVMIEDVDGDKMWGFSSPNGFHTFDMSDVLTEVQAQYMTVLFHKLYEEYDVSWGSAEALSFAYVMSDFAVPYVPIEKRLEPDMTKEEQEEVCKKLLGCIESGNLVVPKGVLPDSLEEAWQTEVDAKNDQDAGCYDDPPYGGFYEDLESFKNNI